jgi:hypothetical protein
MLDGDWSSDVCSSDLYEAEVGNRYCYNSGDPDGGVYLSCDSWSYSYPSQLSESDFGGSMNMASVTVTVQAVPEPAKLALWFAGLGGMAAWWRRRQRVQVSGLSLRTGTRLASAHISS